MLALLLAMACGAPSEGGADCPCAVQITAPLLGEDGDVAPGTLDDGARLVLSEGLAFLELEAMGPPEAQGQDLRVELWLDGEHLLRATARFGLGARDRCSAATWTAGVNVSDPPAEGLSELRELRGELQVEGAGAQSWTHALTLVGGEEWDRDTGGGEVGRPGW